MELDGASLAGSDGAGAMTKNIKCVALAADCFMVGALVGLTVIAGVAFVAAYFRERFEVSE